ncbi:hypothetical protein F5Y16DRAFT_423797 [Xylariaceae sp. FL0255]|nr:hypothetical protein F5Y16DRAFT_423797 [Xylariaceae sp. FL0255]
MDTFNVATKVFTHCGHESFVPIPKDKWQPAFDKPVFFALKCDNCAFPGILSRARRFNNPSNEEDPIERGKLAYVIFDSRHSLSVENVEALMRHWMLGIRHHVFEEHRQVELYEGLAEDVAEKDGVLAGKEFKALFESGHIKFLKNGRGYSRPISRGEFTPTRRRSKRGAMPPLGTPSPPQTPRPGSSRGLSGISSDIGLNKRPTLATLRKSRLENTREVGVQCDEESEEEEPEHIDLLRKALQNLHRSFKDSAQTDHWGDHAAMADEINGFAREQGHPLLQSRGSYPKVHYNAAEGTFSRHKTDEEETW